MLHARRQKLLMALAPRTSVADKPASQGPDRPGEGHLDLIGSMPGSAAQRSHQTVMIDLSSHPRRRGDERLA